MQTTRIVVGLGNPGSEYENTRHNAGFMAVDLLAENLRVSYWKDEAGCKVGLVRFGAENLLLAKPQAFMNLSGKPVSKLLKTRDIRPQGMIVVHDDLDLPEGSLRIKCGGGHGGHNGLRSLIDVLGTSEFTRVRVGIGRPPGRQDPAAFVLEPMRKDSAERYAAAMPHVAQAVLHVLEHGAESAMREYNAN